VIISAAETPILFLTLRLWDRSDEEIPFFLWFNTETRVAAAPRKNGAANRVEISRFAFIADSHGQASQLEKQLPSELHIFIQVRAFSRET
jgi:hypothetical protein